MLQGNIGLLLLWIVGLLAQVAYVVDLWKPHLPLWLGLGGHLLPLCLVLLGDGILDAETVGPRRARVGLSALALGGALALLLSLLCLWLRLRGHRPPGTPMYLTMIALGVVPAAHQLRGALGALGLWGVPPPRQPGRLGRAWAALAVLGWNNLTMAIIGGLFVLAAGVLLLRGRPRDQLMAVSCLFFFALCLGAGVWGAFDRWRALRLGPAARAVPRGVLWGLLGAALVGGLLLLALAAGRGDAPRDQRLYAAAIGAIYLVLGLLPARALGLMPGAVAYRLVPAGLLEQRRGAEVLYPLSALAAVRLCELHGNLAIGVVLVDPARAEYVGCGEAWQRRHQRGLAWALAFSGVHLAITSLATDQPLPVLLEQLVARLEDRGSGDRDDL